MSWRLLERVAGPALRVVLESLWLGALATLLGSGDLGLSLGVALVLTGTGALLASPGRSTSAASVRLRRAGLAATLVLAVAVLVLLEMPSGGRDLAVTVLRDLLAVGVALWLGTRLGGEGDPRGATTQALRCGLLLVGVLVAAAAAGRPLPAGVALVVAAVAAGVLSVAAARVEHELSDAPGGGRAARLSLAAVAVTLAALLAVASLSDPAGGPVRRLLGWIGAGLRVVAEGVGYALGWVAGQAVRLIEWLAEALRGEPEQAPVETASPAPAASPLAGDPGAGSGVVAEVLGWTLVGVVAALVVFLIWRRVAVRRRAAAAATADEHESLAPLRELPRRAALRVRSFLARTEHALAPRDPTDAARREYRRLERSLTAAGHARRPSSTVRAYLTGLPGGPEVGRLGAAAAAIYEGARYSAAGCDWEGVAELRELAARLRGVVPRGGSTHAPAAEAPPVV